jgi:hypothetical protein
LWVEAQRAGLLTADVEGIDLGDRIRARAEDITAGLTTPAEPVSAPVPPAEAPQDVPAPAVAPAAADGVKAGNAHHPLGRPLSELLAASPTPDDPRERRLNAARQGVLSSLESLGMGDAEITEWFGRPTEQVATGRLTALVQEAIAARRAGAEAPAAEELAAEQPDNTEPVPDPDVRPGKLREATLAALLELYGGDLDVLDAAAQEDYGKPLALIGQRRLSEMLTREQAGATS